MSNREHCRNGQYAKSFVCNICGKESTSDPALKRHVRYCRSKAAISKSRKKSCEACSQAKTRCEPRIMGCARCLKRDLPCSFLSTQSSGPETALSDETTILGPSKDLRESLSSSQDQGSDALTKQNPFNGSFPFHFTSEPAILNLLQEDTAISNPISLSSSLISNDKASILGSELPQNLFEPKAFHTINTMMASTMGAGILRSYPALMREERTFPPFIHHAFRVKDNGGDLLLALQNAMSISQSFVNDASDTTVRIHQEKRRILDQSRAGAMGSEDILASIQALIIYLMMRISTGPSDDQEDVELVQALWHMCSQMAAEGSKLLATGQLSSPWKHWVFVESKRRVNSTLRLMRQLYNLEIGTLYPYADITTAFPLPASKLLWLAKSEQEWQKELKRDSYYKTLRLDDLMKFTGSTRNDYPSREEWTRWYAGADELGILVVISTTLL